MPVMGLAYFMYHVPCSCCCDAVQSVPDEPVVDTALDWAMSVLAPSLERVDDVTLPSSSDSQYMHCVARTDTDVTQATAVVNTSTDATLSVTGTNACDDPILDDALHLLFPIKSCDQVGMDSKRAEMVWAPHRKATSLAVSNRQRIEKAIAERTLSKKKSVYEWPVMQKGMKPEQAQRQALASIQRATKEQNDRLRKDTLLATRPDVHFHRLGAMDMPEVAAALNELYEPEVAPHRKLKGDPDSVMDELGCKIEWPWSNGSVDADRVALRAAPFKSSRNVRSYHRLDDLIHTALDWATSDKKRGREHVGVRAWFFFCEDIMGVPAERPMDPMTTPLWEKLEDEWLAMRFVCALVQDKGISVNSAAQYFSSANAWHGREHGVKLAGGLRMERLPAMLKGLKRIVGEAPRAVRRGVAPAMLRKAMDVCLDPENPRDANIRAALATALQGLLRSAEYTCKTKSGKIDESRTLMVSDLHELNDERMVLMMAPCKNMKHLSGKTCPLVIGGGGEFVDAIQEVKNRLRVDPVPPGSESFTPLFRDPSSGRPLAYDTVNTVIKSMMTAIGENPHEFSTHSMRIGGATALFTAGANETVIRTMGRWSSDMHRLYVRACFEQCCDWTRKAGSTTVSDLAGEFDEVDFY